MSDDSEIEALKRIAAALEPLDDAARKRTLQWAISRFQVAKVPIEIFRTFDQLSSDNPDAATTDSHGFETFAELFEAANPSTGKDKALVAAYWVQVCQNQLTFASQSLNVELKDLGHGIGNITEALTALKNERPAQVLQIKKSGTSRQARKIYKLTQEGIKRVQMMCGAVPSIEPY